MFDPVTLDQLRAFVVVHEEGSFSAAARKLQRVQSAISSAMSNLESQLGIQLWDRSAKIAKLTAQGEAVLASSRRVLMEVDALKRLTGAMAEGIEPRVSLCVDALYPMDALTELCTRFVKQFPTVDLQVTGEVMSAVSVRVREGSATLGIVAQPGVLPGLERLPVTSVKMVPVVAATHPLARSKGGVPRTQLADVVQIVLSERLREGLPDQAVLSPRTWRVADLHTKQALLRAGLGWGNLPHDMVRDDVARGRLVVIRPDEWSDEETTLPICAIYRSGTPLGPAHRWVLATLPRLSEGPPKGRKQPAKASKRAKRTISQ